MVKDYRLLGEEAAIPMDFATWDAGLRQASALAWGAGRSAAGIFWRGVHDMRANTQAVYSHGWFSAIPQVRPRGAGEIAGESLGGSGEASGRNERGEREDDRERRPDIRGTCVSDTG